QPPNLRKMIVALHKTTKAGTFPCNRCVNLQIHPVQSSSCYMKYTQSTPFEPYTLDVNHHRLKIKTKSCDTPVGQHFCNQNLQGLQDMKVLILKRNFKTERERKIYGFKAWNTLRQGLNLGSGFMSHYVI
ncbi:hypothetical protein XELAEV_18001221mg, partial [Xenopus laevis]